MRPDQRCFELNNVVTLWITFSWIGHEHKIVSDRRIEVLAGDQRDVFDSIREKLHDGTPASFRPVGVNRFERIRTTSRRNGQRKNSVFNLQFLVVIFRHLSHFRRPLWIAVNRDDVTITFQTPFVTGSRVWVMHPVNECVLVCQKSFHKRITTRLGRLFVLRRRESPSKLGV